MSKLAELLYFLYFYIYLYLGLFNVKMDIYI